MDSAEGLDDFLGRSVLMHRACARRLHTLLGGLGKLVATTVEMSGHKACTPLPREQLRG